MSMMVNVLNPSLALLTDLYELTMAYGYWKHGLADREACFHVSFRKTPFAGGYAIACGLASAIDYLKKIQFGDGDNAFLAKLEGNDGKPMFDRAFLVYLRRLRFNLEVDAVPEGTAVFANEPLLRVKGPLLQAQIVETALLNMLNFQTLVATKAARICEAARGDQVLEFGLRRAQGVDGAMSATRASFIGGCAATSNVLAGKVFGIPVRGTHAHSWVMSFDGEPEAFEAYAKAMPNNCVFLVDTYDTLAGVQNAIEVGKQLRQRGHEMVGIRLDSGDLAYLSIEARKMLDAAGFPKARILASNDLDEYLIADLKQQGAKIAVWGVGTKMVTAYDQPALGGVYKLSAMRDAEKKWRHKIKLSEQAAKVSIPGVLQVRRFKDAGGNFLADAIYDTLTGVGEHVTIVDPSDMTRRKEIPPGTSYDDLLVPVFRDGKSVYDQPPLVHIRQRTGDQLASLHPTIRRFKNPHRYPAGLEENLFDLRSDLIMKARGAKRSARPAVTPALPGPTEVAPPPPPVDEEGEEQAVMMDADGEGIESVADSADTAVAAFYQEPEPEIAPEPELKPQPIPAATPHPKVQPARPAASQSQPVAQPQPAPQRPALDGPEKKPLQPHPPRKTFGGIGSKHGQPLKPGSTVRVNVARVVKPRTPFAPRPQRDEQ